ncbi:Negative regulator of allantoin and glyoxylate utilization operons [Achromobacter spanius]|uniref:IclR family transcriptional regulator n=1 Tax=Achromobacter spanius TaxID=217203 RepID=UPI000C2C3EFC|nr:helix-turn-helix domain-containing protein [Achromobacter spanius]AUA54776.1 IclR family transcriptional regulator [Achromobacter spanius]CAB3635483.1 HTH-type transcriptional regulator XynR [Achromobacter spanius]SPT39611.1 Negative regulator of allantoin and glyoxylate utilization operons [Achromobacter denitrificans]VEE57816.1 Negative regulator of allantoin and glyoxylate utilization operons [Achromobacter spanius]
MPSQETSLVSATKKVCRVLASLSSRRVQRLTDIAQAAQLDVSTALRILKDLEAEGFVERDPVSKHYMLGPQIYAMHHAMVDGLDLRGLARASLIRLARKFGDTVILSMPTGWESVCLDLCFGDYPIRANYLDVGSRRPLGVGAGSLALLAALDESEAHAVLPPVRQWLRDRYPNYPAQVMDRMTARARKAGHSMLLDVVVDKMGGLGVAVRGPSGRAIAALSVAALSDRIRSRETELAQALTAEARAIERAWMPHA